MGTNVVGMDVGAEGVCIEEAARAYALRYPQFRVGQSVQYESLYETIELFDDAKSVGIQLRILPDLKLIDERSAARIKDIAARVQGSKDSRFANVYQFTEISGHSFIVCERPRGQQLQKLLDSGREFTPDEAVALTSAICRAVAAGHGFGLIHREFSPFDVWVDEQGGVQISGFGIAEMAYIESSDWVLAMSKRPTESRVYVAPEIVEGAAQPDYRADIYSIGILFYRLLMGNVPGGLCVLPSSKVALERRVDDVVLKALQKAPDRRYGSVSEFEAEILSLGVGNPNEQLHLSAPPPRRENQKTQKKSRVTHSTSGGGAWGLAVFSILAIVLLAVGVYGVVYFLNKEEFQKGKAAGGTLAEAEAHLLGGRPEEAIAVIGHILRTCSEDSDKCEAGLDLLVAHGEEGTALNLAQTTTNGLEKGLGKERLGTLTKILGSSVGSYEESMEQALAHQQQGDKKGEKNALLDAIGHLPNHPDPMALLAANSHASDESLDQALARMGESGELLYTYEAEKQRVALDVSGNSALKDVSALKGIPISEMDLRGTAVEDLAPLQGMPLKELYLDRASVEQLSHLEGMPLQVLSLDGMELSNEEASELLTKFPLLRSLNYLSHGKLVSHVRRPKMTTRWANSLGMRFMPLIGSDSNLVSTWETRRKDLRPTPSPLNCQNPS